MKPITRTGTLFITAHLLFISLSGCAVTGNPASFAQGTKVQYNPYLKTTSIVGPNIVMPEVFYFLDRVNGADSIVGGYEGSSWAFLYAAYDIDGVQIPFQKLGSTVDVGSVSEKFAVDLPSTYLRNHLSDPIRIRLMGQNGSVDISMSPFYIQGFLSRAESQ